MRKQPRRAPETAPEPAFVDPDQIELPFNGLTARQNRFVNELQKRGVPTSSSARVAIRATLAVTAPPGCRCILCEAWQASA